jgi:CRISPR/Cas system-associated exonuclease Cas4 (RecB family)
MAELTNDFSWSFTRHRTFETCRRKYYYAYYGSWGGWEEGADERTKLLYRLKKITTVPMLVGDIVHQVINASLDYLGGHAEYPLEKAEQRAIDQFKQAWRESKEKAWKKSPSRATNLFEHYYQEELSQEALLEFRDALVENVHGFYHSESYGFIKTISKREWLTKEKLTTLDVDGIPVWVKLDFAARYGNRVYIYDWKTGRVVKEDELQLAVYALYAMEHWGVQIEDLRLFDIYLRKQLPVKVKVNQSHILQTEQLIHRSSNAMLNLLEDESSNLAREDQFPLIDNPNICRRCNFKAACYGDHWADL